VRVLSRSRRAAGAAVGLALVLAGCGDDAEPAAQRTPAAVTPVPTTTPVPTAADGIHATPGATGTPTATATATASPAGEGTGGAQAGDEEGIRVPVDVTVSADRIRASVERVAAFLPVRFSVRNTLDREVGVVVVRSGEGGDAVGRATVGPGRRADIDVDGLQPGSLEILSPDLDPDMTAIVAVQRDG
jgi:hypothetical protein